MDIALNAAGGLALFLLAMAMMTDGLKVLGGRSLKTLLNDWTSNVFRGVLSGALVTAIVQSSSAVTIATIGFVNAGALSLKQALGVIFGANVGTTMTGWLVSVVGFGFKIEAFALPILAIGVATRLAAPNMRLKGLGDALTGFGLFFLGLTILKTAFSGIADVIGTGGFAQTAGIGSTLTFVAAGFVITFLTQSSSAAIALILTAASQDVLSLEAAAGAVIGANVGTTTTALLAVISATPNAKRVAAGHLAFNAFTGIIALIMLPGVLFLLQQMSGWWGLSDQPAPLLAMFHTSFNVLGVALLLPFVGLTSRRLNRMFRTEAEDLSLPQHLDTTVLVTPALALMALREELARLFELVCSVAADAIHRKPRRGAHLKTRSDAILNLSEAIDGFATSVRMDTLTRADAEDLPRALRISRYLEEAARLAPDVLSLANAVPNINNRDASSAVDHVLQTAGLCIERFHSELNDPDATPNSEDRLSAFSDAYQNAKSALLRAAARHDIHVDLADDLLDALSRTRRMIEQIEKAGRLLAPESENEEPSPTRDGQSSQMFSESASHSHTDHLDGLAQPT